MSAHLKQAICRVSQIGHELAMQPTGDDRSDLAKANLLDELFHETKEMLEHAIDTIPTYIADHKNDDTFVYLKHKIDDIHEDGELKEFIKTLEEATDEPPYDLHKEEGYTMQNTGCTPFIRGK